MKKFYRNATPEKPKPKTKAQKLRDWEYTVIGGGLVRNSAFPRTAAKLNRGRGAMVRVIGVPLASDKQFAYLDALSEEGILGQTPEEVAAWFIREGILRDIESRVPKCGKCGK